MQSELHKLRIEKSQKARTGSRPLWPTVLILALLVLAGGAAYLKFGTSAPALSVQTLRVHPTQPSDAPADLVALNATGYIIAAHRIELASKVLGRVAWIGVEMGDKVKKDQVLVRLEDDEYKARVAQEQGQLDSAIAHLAELKAGPRPQEIAQAQAQYDRAKIEMENAQRSYQRLVDVKGSLSVSATELDDARSNMLALQAQAEYQHQQVELLQAGTRKEDIDAQDATVAELKGVLAQAQLDLSNTIIRAPFDSTILERNVEVGEFVTTGFVGDRGAKGFVVSLADLSDLLVELDISQDDFAKISMNQACWITTDAYPDRKYHGVVSLISPVANRQKATVQVRVKILSPDELLKPDMNASVSFLSQKPDNATAPAGAAAGRPVIRVPASAVRNGAVFVVENGQAHSVPVTLGMSAADGQVQINSGLIGGEDLILHPPESLHEGDRVKPESPAVNP